MLMEINPVTPEPRKIRRVVEVLNDGGLIAYPTDTVYGIGCDLFNKKPSIVCTKSRPCRARISWRSCAAIWPKSLSTPWSNDYEYRILKEYPPWPYCFILHASKEVPKVVQSTRKHVGVRIPNHPVALAVVQELGHIHHLQYRSAPRAAGVHRPEGVRSGIQGLDLVIDGGAGGDQPPPTVIDSDR